MTFHPTSSVQNNSKSFKLYPKMCCCKRKFNYLQTNSSLMYPRLIYSSLQLCLFSLLLRSNMCRLFILFSMRITFYGTPVYQLLRLRFLSLFLPFHMPDWQNALYFRQQNCNILSISDDAVNCQTSVVQFYERFNLQQVLKASLADIQIFSFRLLRLHRNQQQEYLMVCQCRSCQPDVL